LSPSSHGSADRLRVGVIGAGPVGTVLGQALAAAGHQVIADASSDPQQTLAEADLVLFAIPAAELAATISGYAKAGLFKPGQLVAHTAGEFGIDVLQSAAELGVIPLAIHPAMTFTGTSIDLTRIRESYFGVAAPNAALPIAQALVIEMGAEPIVVSDENRKTYFEAISVANNFSKLIVNQSIGLLESIGVEHARVVLGPLIRSAVEEALADGHTPINPEELLD
jgi:predicted short-subunit dehydrogenase-like oxidoreductase (DUF2520 family)